MQMALTADGHTAAGGTPLIMHNERLMDPLDDYTRAIAKISGKRKKTDAEHMEMSRLEFLGGLYTNGNGPCVPTWNMIRCLQEGAKRTRRGKDVLRGVTPLGEHTDLGYEGLREPDEMWKAGGFSIRKGVGVGTKRIMRTRPIFTDWVAVLMVEVDPVILDPDIVTNIWVDAGKYEGLGDMRPIMGRFKGSATEWTIRTDDGLAEAASALAAAIAAKRIQAEDIGRKERHGLIEEIVQGGKREATRLSKQAKS